MCVCSLVFREGGVRFCTSTCIVPLCERRLSVSLLQARSFRYFVVRYVVKLTLCVINT